jgi:hypothetical protein
MRVRASGSFRRYRLDSRALDGGARRLRDDGPALEKRLQSNRFRSIDQAGSEVSSVGWCRADGTTPRGFVAEDHWLQKVLGVALRIDQKKLPAGALRVRRMEAEAAERREAGERIAPARRREIVDRLETELMARVVPSTALFAMYWEPERAELLLNTTSDGHNVAFRTLFRETFDVAPEPLPTAALAAQLLGAKGARQVAEAAPAIFVDGGVVAVPESPAFLGAEFLLWLWHQCETAGGRFELDRLGDVGVAFDALLELGGAEGGGRVTVRGETPTRAAEAGSALLAGKLPQKARLVLARGERNFHVTLNATTFDLESVKVEAEAEEITDENLRAGDEQRAGWLFELCDLVDSLFSAFLELRLSDDFDGEVLPALRDWIVARTRARARGASAAR